MQRWFANGKVDVMPRDITRDLGGPVLSLVRIVVGFLFVTRGASTLFGVLGGANGSGSAAPFLTWPFWWAGLIQFALGGLVMLGLFTRVAAMICSGSMAFAYFVAHQAEGPLPLMNGGEPAVLFCWAFLLIAVLGPGPYALDALRRAPRRAGDPVGEPAS
jgi:putative oxidoreductase